MNYFDRSTRLARTSSINQSMRIIQFIHRLFDLGLSHKHILCLFTCHFVRRFDQAWLNCLAKLFRIFFVFFLFQKYFVIRTTLNCPFHNWALMNCKIVDFFQRKSIEWTPTDGTP